MSERMKNRRAVEVMAASVLAVLLIAAPRMGAQAQPEDKSVPDRAELLKIKPDMGGFRHGISIEPDPIDFADHTGYTSIFDGKTLTGWDGQPDLWKVEDGAIVGETKPEMFPPHAFPNTFLILRGVQAKDFDLKLEIKVEKGGGSGIQYRSTTLTPEQITTRKASPGRDPRWAMIGPQADFWYPVSDEARQFSGQLYSQNNYRGTIVWRGQVVQSFAGKIPQLVGNIGDRAALGAFVKDGEWNEYTIIARGGVILHILNGQLMAVLVDDDPVSSNNISGVFGLQIEGVPCKVSFRNLWLKKIN